MWKDAFKNASVILVGSIISRFFFFLFTACAVRMLSVEQYGLFAFLISLHTWLLVFAHFNFPAAISKYISEDLQRGRPDEIWKYYYGGLLLTIFFSAFSVLAGVLLSVKMNIEIAMLFVFFSSLIMMSIYRLNDGLLRGHGFFQRSAILDIVNGFSRFALLLPFLFASSKISFNLFLTLYCVATLPSFGLSVFNVHRLRARYRGGQRPEWEKIKDIFSYSKWICFTDLASSGNILVINFILALYSYEDLAVFNVALLIYQIFNIALSSITNVIIPAVSRSVVEGKSISMPDGIKLTYLFIFSSCVSGMIIFLPFKREILTAIFHKVIYSESMKLAAILLLLFPLRVYSTIAKGILQGMNRPRQGAMISLGSLILISMLVMPLYSMVGLYGVILAMCITYFLEYALYTTSVNQNLLALRKLQVT